VDRLVFNSNNGKKIKRINETPSDKSPIGPMPKPLTKKKNMINVPYFHANPPLLPLKGHNPETRTTTKYAICARIQHISEKYG
jgi:hypothetical protein